jgi:hypothetical protein
VWQILRVPLALLVMLAGTMTLTLLWTRSGERLPEPELPPRTGDWICETNRSAGPWSRPLSHGCIDLVRSGPEGTLITAADWLTCSCPGER